MNVIKSFLAFVFLVNGLYIYGIPLNQFDAMAGALRASYLHVFKPFYFFGAKSRGQVEKYLDSHTWDLK